MPYSIELAFDPVSAGAMERVWEQLALLGNSLYSGDSGSRPHVTLAVCEDILPSAEAALCEFAARTSPVQIALSYFGCFLLGDQLVSFLAPAVTAELLEVQRDFHDAFSAQMLTPWSYYSPGRWVPHCTLSMGISPAELPELVEACQKAIQLPQPVDLLEIGLVRFQPSEQLAWFELGKSVIAAGE